MASEEPIIRDNVSNFSDVEQQHDVHEHREPNNQSESSSYFETISSCRNLPFDGGAKRPKL